MDAFPEVDMTVDRLAAVAAINRPNHSAAGPDLISHEAWRAIGEWIADLHVATILKKFSCCANCRRVRN